MKTIHGLLQSITKWHHDRNLIDGATDKDQVCKLIQEVGELSDNVCKGNDIRDDIGDIIVVLVNIAERNGLSIEECLECAWNDIKDRKGRMANGVFIKEEDGVVPSFNEEATSTYYTEEWEQVDAIIKDDYVNLVPDDDPLKGIDPELLHAEGYRSEEIIPLIKFMPEAYKKN